MNYSNFNLHLNTDVRSFEFNDNTINVLQYLPIEDKNSIIQLALQNSEENGVYNLLKVQMYFRLYLIYLYADIEFINDEKDDPVKLYDELNSNSIIDMVINAMDQTEYAYLLEVLQETMNQKLEYRNTIASVINNFVENLVPNAEGAAEILKNFNPENFEHVMKFVEAANGGRPIN